MTYSDFYLRFPDADTASATLADIVQGEGYQDWDVVGAIEGAAGWHVNFRTEDSNLPTSLAPYQISAPLIPKHVWLSTNESVI